MQYIVAAGITLLGLVIVGAFILPLRSINWGKVTFQPGNTVTVTGEARLKEENRKASFTAGVSAVKDKKDDAVNEVNQKTTAIIDAVKASGVKPEDIKTQNLSIWQEEETYTEGGKQKTRPGQWRVNSTIEITLTDASRAGALAELLSRAGATNVNGPNFTIEEENDARNELLGQAVAEARKKAEILAKASNKKLGSILVISEGTNATQPYPLYERAVGGGGGAMEPGTTTVTKSVTVTWELVGKGLPIELPRISFPK
jgi:uncharacterized protein YggE